MGKKLADIPQGTRIGRWTIDGPPIKKVFASVEVLAYSATCECGTKRVITASGLRSGHTTSCGCLRGANISRNRRTHGESSTPLYGVWQSMKRRCNLKTDLAYGFYGAKGISVCAEWMVGYLPFRDWALSHGYVHGLTIDRINGTGNYEPLNCRWATYREQANNLITNRYLEIFGESKTIAEWGHDARCVVCPQSFSNRIHCNWPPEEALTIRRYGIKHPDYSLKPKPLK